MEGAAPFCGARSEDDPHDPLAGEESKVTLNHGHLDHPGVVDGGFLKPCEYRAAFFQPADDALDNVAISIARFIEFDPASVTISFDFEGITGVTPRSSSIWSIQSAR